MGAIDPRRPAPPPLAPGLGIAPSQPGGTGYYTTQLTARIHVMTYQMEGDPANRGVLAFFHAPSELDEIKRTMEGRGFRVDFYHPTIYQGWDAAQDHFNVVQGDYRRAQKERINRVRQKVFDSLTREEVETLAAYGLFDEEDEAGA